MSGHRNYTVSETAIQQGRNLGLLEKTAERIAIIAKRSAPFSHPAGNRRFQSFVLSIENNTVIAIHSIT